MSKRTPVKGETGAEPKRASAWLTQGFEELVYKVKNPTVDFGKPEIYDVVIVGSGYGGAIAAANLAGCTRKEDGGEISVCVLERGREYLPGMFPSRLSELPGHVRFSTANSPRPRGVREGLFDVRVGPDVCALVANGVGGGSLINAGVMEEPSDEVFSGKCWPPEFLDKSERDKLYARAREALGVPEGNTIERHADGIPLKFRALEDLASSAGFRAASITVAMKSGNNGAGIPREKCVRCGDCATGCNHKAKDSLDVNLLVKARRRGAKIYTGATVLRVERDRHFDCWLLSVVHTDDKLRRRQGAPLKVAARKVILAAGTFGSTEILLRSQSDELKFSPRLGQSFSSNGDTIAVAYRQTREVNAVANECDAPNDRKVGPTITGMIDLRGSGQPGYVIEELAIPGPLRRAFEEVVTMSDALQGLTESDTTTHEPGKPDHDPCAVDARAIARSSVFAVMGHDGAGGSLELVGGGGDDDKGDGGVRVRWQELRENDLFKGQVSRLRKLADHSKIKGRILPNPLWQLLPERMKSLLDNQRGPLFTVHPLGGCPMGSDPSGGAVNWNGQVFGLPSESQPPDVYQDLVVLDGAIVPTSLGINPALTITALALRAVKNLASEWSFEEGDCPEQRLPERPDFHSEKKHAPQPPRRARTEVEFVERMSGSAVLTGTDGSAIPCVLELTLPFNSVPLEELMLPVGGPVPMTRTLTVNQHHPARSAELRIFLENQWRDLREHDPDEGDLDKQAIVRASLSGTLKFWRREARSERERACNAMRAYLLNRGIRDLWQWLADRFELLGWRKFLSGTSSDPEADPLTWPLCRALARMAHDSRALASRAGEVRRLEYELRIENFLKSHPNIDFKGEREIRGAKRLTYARRSNPWRQLMEMSLGIFPCLQGDAVLKLDLKFFATRKIPLFHIVGQQDAPSAMVDLASFFAYFFRLLLSIHLWSFRKPETPTPREPQRLPGAIECRLPPPSIREIEVDELPNGAPVYVRLTRYRPSNARGLPVVMIHGYSASGTTFAHHAVDPNMAEYFCRRKRDVWVLDLRTSSGMPTARYPWVFEDAALIDLPAAFDHIHRETGKKLDVVAHCMGSAMFSMVTLKAPVPGERYFRERTMLPTWIHRAVLSQIAPVVILSPVNVFRAYLLSYLRRFLPLAGYDFRVRPDPDLMDQLIDRLLATLPYPEEEFDVENPVWPCKRTPFVGTRHRMDALYGRDFSLARKNGEAQLTDKVLEYIDDLFGPLSIETVSQGINFALGKTITNRAGRNDYVSTENIKARWKFPTLSIHGEENGLSDVSTLAEMERAFVRNAEAPVTTLRFPGFGHQDSLIGVHAKQVFRKVYEFLDEVSS